MKKSKIKISVIIPTRNSWMMLKDCIESIQSQTLKPQEIIVVDNGSTDGTSEKIKKKFPKIKLIKLSTNTGVTGGRNRGIKELSSDSEYVLFFDHDMVADKDMLEELVKVAEMEPKIGIVTPKIYYFGNRNRIWSAGTGINLWTGQVIFRGGNDFGQYESIEEVQVAPAAILVKRKVIEKIGGFDDVYFATYEDTDFCFRAKEKGFKTFYAPDALAYHQISWDPKDDAVRVLSRAYFVGRNRVIFMKKFGKNFFVFALFIPIFILYYLKLAIKLNMLKDWFNFLQGIAEGLFGIYIIEKNIPFTYINLIRGAIGNNVKTIIDLGCGEGKLIQALSRGENWEVVGVDVDSVSIEKAKVISCYKKLIVADLEKIAKMFIKQKKKFDVVLCSQVIEHLSKEKGERLLDLVDKIADKRVVISTPNGFMEQIEESLATNTSYQQHISRWEVNDFSSRGYKVYGTGLKLIWSYGGLARNKSKFVSFWFRITSYIVSPFVYHLPFFGVNLLGVKKL